MSYTIEIMIAGPPSPDGDVETRMYQLSDPYDTVASAKEAAEAHLAELGLQPMKTFYNVFDRGGFTVFSSSKQPVEAVKINYTRSMCWCPDLLLSSQ